MNGLEVLQDFFKVGKVSYLNNVVTKVGGCGHIGGMSKFIISEECCSDLR